jgi:hypothetical protein
LGQLFISIFILIYACIEIFQGNKKMLTTANDEFIFWKKLSDLIINDNFQYIDSMKYNIEISNVSIETYELCIRDDINVSIYDYFNSLKEQRKAFIYIVLEDILCNEKFNAYLAYDTFINKNIIEDALRRISVQLSNNDYEFPSNNDYSKIFNQYKFDSNKTNPIYNINSINSLSKNYQKHVNKKLNIHMIHNKLYEEIVSIGLDVWRDTKNLHLYYRIKSYEDKQKIGKRKLADFLSKLFNKDIEIYDDTGDIKYLEGNFLIISLLPMVKNDVFNPLIDIEFPYIVNNMFYRNTFRFTDYLRKRTTPTSIPTVQQNSIVEFIKLLTKDDYTFYYIMTWLSNYFQRLTSSKTILVLIGDEGTTSTLINYVIKPIFASKNEYWSLINDETLIKPKDILLNDKIFYHFGEFSNIAINNKKASALILEILTTKHKREDAWENNESYIDGELIVTSSKESPYRFLKDSYSRCSVFRVWHLDTILKKMHIDRISLIQNIQNDLENFSRLLAQYSIQQEYLYIADTGMTPKE